MTSREQVPVRRLALVLGGLLVSVLATWIVTRGVNLEDAWAIATQASPGWLLAALGVVTVQTFLRAARWRALLPARPPRAGRPSRPSIMRIVPVVLIGYLGNAVLPARLGEAARGVLVARREDLPATGALGSVVIERVLDTLVLALLGIGAALLIGVPDWIVRVALLGVLISAAAVIGLSVAPGLLHRLGGGRLGRVASGALGVLHGANVSKRPRAIGLALLLSALAWVLDASIYWLVGRSVGVELTPFGAMLVATVTVLSTAVPAAPGYVGTFELAAVAAAGVLGVDPTTALAFAVVAHAVAVLPIAIAGAVALAVVGVDARLLTRGAGPGEHATSTVAGPL